MTQAIAATPVSLRSRKRQKTHARILASAIALFRESGIRATRSSQIAAAAEVSPATLFNYFPTRADLAEAWVRKEIGAELLVMVREAGDGSLRAALRRRSQPLAAWAWRDRELLAEAWHVVARAANPALGHRDLLASWVGRAQERGEIRRDLRASDLTEILLDAIEGGILHGVVEADGPEALAAGLRARVDLVLDGMRRRNERVSVAAATLTDPTAD